MEEDITLADLPWEDVIFKHIFPSLDLKTLFSIGSTSSTYREMTEEYFKMSKIINIGKHGAKVTEKALGFLLKENKCCQKLILKNCKSSLNCKILEPMLERNRHLVHLDLTQCTSLTNNSLQTLAVNCRKMRHLILRDCVWASSPAVTNIGLQCRELIYLDLSGCWNINDEAVSVISQACNG